MQKDTDGCAVPNIMETRWVKTRDDAIPQLLHWRIPTPQQKQRHITM